MVRRSNWCLDDTCFATTIFSSSFLRNYMTIYLNVFGSLMKHGIFSNVYCYLFII